MSLNFEGDFGSFVFAVTGTEKSVKGPICLGYADPHSFATSRLSMKTEPEIPFHRNTDTNF